MSRQAIDAVVAKARGSFASGKCVPGTGQLRVERGEGRPPSCCLTGAAFVEEAVTITEYLGAARAFGLSDYLRVWLQSGWDNGPHKDATDKEFLADKDSRYAYQQGWLLYQEVAAATRKGEDHES